MNLRIAAAARDRRAAWTLVETMVVVGIGSLIMASLMQTWLFTARSFVAMGNYVDLDQASRNALDRMSRDIRQAKVFSPTYSQTNYLVFTNLDSSFFCYLWDPQTKQVSKLTGNYSGGNFVNIQTNCLMTGCDYFSFRIWQRNPATGFTFPYSATADPVNTKLVDISWRCIRRVLNQFNTESVQTARIVLRN